MPPQGFNLMAFPSAVEVKFSILLTVIMIDWHAVGIVVVPQDGQNSAQFSFQNPDALLRRQLLLLPEHLPEHFLLSPYLLVRCR